jgi:hypothetical protein
MNPWQTTASLTTCVGDYCCAENTAYDASLNQCVSSPGAPGNSFTNDFINATQTIYQEVSGQALPQEGFTENMVDKVLTKKQPNKKIDFDLKAPKPFNKNFL